MASLLQHQQRPPPSLPDGGSGGGADSDGDGDTHADLLVRVLQVVAGQSLLPKDGWSLSRRLHAEINVSARANVLTPIDALTRILATRRVVKLRLGAITGLSGPLQPPSTVRHLDLQDFNGEVRLPPRLRSLAMRGMSRAAAAAVLARAPDALEELTVDFCPPAAAAAAAAPPLPRALRVVRIDLWREEPRRAGAYSALLRDLATDGLPAALAELCVRRARVTPAARLPRALRALTLLECDAVGDFNSRGDAPWLPEGLTELRVRSQSAAAVCLGPLPAGLRVLFAAPAALVIGAGAPLPWGLRDLTLHCYGRDGAQDGGEEAGGGGGVPAELEELPDGLQALKLCGVPWPLRLPPRLAALAVSGADCPPLAHLPPTLRVLVLVDHAHALPPLPCSLRALQVAGAAAHALPPLPPALRALDLGQHFKFEVDLPPGLRSLSISASYDRRLALPPALRALRVGTQYIHPLPPLPCTPVWPVREWPRRYKWIHEHAAPPWLRCSDECQVLLADLQQ
ncbi:hypothetical protein JKP88DRAFT_315168 [Tribonema minus]|uniref:Uncharacterized protein n=1 Tax=Tribonema minus TaxID=303371 RepID=A0A835Z8W7_9STRA|nr:hypothetical protein JKP88DRAFT_315168 [Tribonema minus]